MAQLSEDYDEIADVEAALNAAETAVQPGDPVSNLAETATAKILTDVERASIASAVQPDFADLGDVEDIAITCVAGTYTIRAARLDTNGGTLTITPAGASEYAEAVLFLTSDADGTKTIAVAGTPKWMGMPLTLAPETGQTIVIYVQSIKGEIILAADIAEVPA